MLNKIVKIEIKHVCENNENRIIYENGFEIVPVSLPNLNEDDIVSFSDEYGNVEEFTYNTIENYLNSEKLNDYEEERISFLAEQPVVELSETKVMEMHYEDITEQEMFDFPPIKEGILTNKEQGLWAYHGLRKFKFYLEDMPEIISDPREKMEVKAAIVFNKKDNSKIEEIKVEEIRVKNKTKELNKEFFAYIDTNKFGEEFDNKAQRMLFSGFFELTFEFENSKNTYIFPISILVNNTNYDTEINLCTHLQQSKIVSIDFGTSSTCVAVRNGKDISLLTLSSENLGENQFENPTNLMIYRWDNIYEQWKKENESFPILSKGTRENEKYKEKDVWFDFGYTVKNVLEDAQNAELSSILTQIKLIPYKIAQGEQIEINPLIKENKNVVKLVTSSEEEDDEHFDPIAFYGYLLGRAINNPSQSKIYTKFDITYPVKFNSDVREKTRKSLEYGLKRSLPLPLREAKNKKGKPLLSVEMKYAEPIAYIGAMCGKYIKIDEDGKPCLFAVYDFGGGTLDYSFGMFRATEDEEYAIDIYGVDGDENIGGESLISLISFWIYSSDANKKTMVEKNIPFELPKGEKFPDDVPNRLINKSGIAKSNLRKLNESFSRKLFENRNEGRITDSTIDLFDENNDLVEVNISVDYEELEDALKNILQKTVDNFYDSMQRTFENNKENIEKYNGEYSIEKVEIFKAGNSSRSVLIEKMMNEKFPNNNIHLIDEIIDKNEKKRYAITPKTAVAFGQLRLNEFEVNDLNGTKEAPFKWYVGNINKGNGNFILKINKNDNSKEWKKLGVVRGDIINVYYSGVLINHSDEGLETQEIVLDDDYSGSIAYIRVFNDSAIEYCICDKGEEPEEKSEVNKDNIVVLK